MSPTLLIVASVLLGVVGQLTLKAGLTRTGALPVGDGVLQVLRRMAAQPAIIGGLLVFGVGTSFWLLALSQVELSYAYPFLSLSYVLILASSWAVFGEVISWWRLLGVVSICLGVCVAAVS